MLPMKMGESDTGSNTKVQRVQGSGLPLDREGLVLRRGLVVRDEVDQPALAGQMITNAVGEHGHQSEEQGQSR